MKKRIYILLAVILSLTLFAVPISASETEGDTEEYSIEINLITRGSEAEGLPFVAYFRNTATDEIIGFYLEPTGYNSFPVAELTAGEYLFERIVLANRKNEEYATSGEVKILEIVEDDYTFYTIQVSGAGTKVDTDSAFSSATVLRPVEDNSNNPENNPLFWRLLVGIFVPVTLSAVLWIINAIRGRRNFYRRFVAKLYKHITIAIFSFMFACALAGDSDLPALLVIPFCTGFPFGFVALSTFRASYSHLPSEEDMRAELRARDLRSYDENSMNDSALGCSFLFLGALCGIVGVVALPVVLIKDIINIRKYKHLNVNFD